MQLKDITKTVDQMTQEELLERLREIRHNQTVARPAAKRRVANTEKKASRKKTAKVEDLLSGLTPEELATLLTQLEQGGGE